jgi:hypothetical protein
MTEKKREKKGTTSKTYGRLIYSTARESCAPTTPLSNKDTTRRRQRRLSPPTRKETEKVFLGLGAVGVVDHQTARETRLHRGLLDHRELFPASGRKTTVVRVEGKNGAGRCSKYPRDTGWFRAAERARHPRRTAHCGVDVRVFRVELKHCASASRQAAVERGEKPLQPSLRNVLCLVCIAQPLEHRDADAAVKGTL